MMLQAGGMGLSSIHTGVDSGYYALNLVLRCGDPWLKYIIQIMDAP